MDRVTRYPILSIPHSSKVSDLPSDQESHYTFDVVQVESVSPGWDEDFVRMNSGGQSFIFGPEETSGLRMMTVTQETVPMPHLVKETQHVLIENYSVNQWNPSWEQKSQLEVVETGPTYTLRACPEERHPGKLYSGEDEEKEQQLYHLGPGEDVFPKRRKDLEREREAVIRGQVVKRSTTVATRWSSQEELDKIYFGQDPSPTSASDSENVIDTEQINFLAARKQFMNLEKLTLNSQPPQKPMGRTMQSTRASPEVGPANVGQSSRSCWSSRVGLTNGSITGQGKDGAEGARPGLALAPTSYSRSVSQLSWASVDGAQALGSEEMSPESVLPDEGPKETPIEREIRRAQEREADLRQQRGLQRSGSRDELVEVPARPLLSNITLITSTPKKVKEMGRPSSLYIQREIALDTKREEDYRRQVGRSEPTNDATRASTPCQLARDSEIPKEAPEMRRVQSSDSILSLTSDTHPVEATLEGRKINRIPLEAYQPYLGPHSAKMEFPSYSSYKQASSLGSGYHTMGSGQEEGVATPPPSSQKASWDGEQIREQPWKLQASTIQRQEAWRSPHQESTRKAWDAQQQDAANASQGVVPRSYFCLQPMKAKVSCSPESEEVNVPQQDRAWEPKGRVEEVAIHIKPLKSQSSSLLEMEIQSVLQRERELEEERRNAMFPEVFSPATELDQSFEWENPNSRYSSMASGITGSYSVSETPTFSPVHFHSGLVWKVTEQTPGQGVRWRTKRDGGYAGLDTSDAVNTEIVEATKVTRHKNAIATRWEAGIYASEEED
ncbi:mitotic interactor and substrate of PLK1 [Phascolarctos cinereus]|uniref:Mitotic interactor and substrate of PLK1 n=1 Tax=Phascolarctos cinereus TaxID=38626 RepID=A0A6P5M1U6_PHACI|nr:mitotic interactor and substrate of PLK1 [Phascolarctos cinereus]XP_020864717.1 mitotic interactor and substrate of PLK1 [Phascolarctos cinereus]